MLAILTVKKYFPKVTTVVDGTDEIFLNVMENDCKFGIEGDPRSCAFARAAQREHNGAIVGLNSCYIVDGTVATRYRHEESRKLKKFDKGLEQLTPGVIRLLPFGPNGKLGKKDPGVAHPKSTRKRRAFHHTIAQEDRTGVRVL